MPEDYKPRIITSQLCSTRMISQLQNQVKTYVLFGYQVHFLP